MTRTDLETTLGEPSGFIITAENRHLVTQWAIAAGFEPSQVHTMSSVQLANLYHAHGVSSKPSELQRITSDMLVQLVRSLPPFDEELVAYIAAKTITGEASTTYIQSLIEKYSPAPRVLDVTSARGISRIEATTHYTTETVIKVASIGHAIMLVGPAGCGKTTIAEHTALALRLPFYLTSTINDTHELMGFVDGYGKYHTTPFRVAYENGGLWCADEIDAWDASALLAANSALANGNAAFPDNPLPVRRHADFRMIATANTFGTGADRIYIGRNELDAASLDRFATINVDYDLTLERMFCSGNDQWLEHVWKIRRIVQERKIRHVVSSRAISMGVAALAIGLEWDDVEEMYLYKGMNTGDRSKIEDDM